MPLPSTPAHALGPDDPPQWMVQGLCYYPLSLFFRLRFGHPAWKISIDAGLSCPNVDGTLSRQGCLFCNVRSFSPSRRQDAASRSVARQIADGRERLIRRYGPRRAGALIAYFQPATNTHGPIDRLRAVWREALQQPGVVGLAVGTRPDCAGEAVLDVLTELAAEKWVSVEYGVQSIHQNSLQWLQRGHDFTCCESAIKRTLSRGLNVAVHLILGLPGESRDEMNATAEAMARLRVNTVKLHNLHVVRDTPLATLWRAGGVRLPSLEEYAAEVVDFLERLPPDCVIDRLSGDAPPEFFIAPQWSQDKFAVRRAVEGEFARRGTRQGSRWVG